MRLPIATKSASGRSKPVGIETLVNAFVEKAAEGSKSPVTVHGTPGLVSFASLSGGPCRGMLVMNGELYVAADKTLYRVAVDGTATSLGAIPSGGRVGMSHNGTEVVVTDGTVDYLDGFFIFGGGVHWGYAYDDTNGFRDISSVDADFPVTNANGAFFISDLLSGVTYDALDFATAESYPDPLLRVFVDHREVWLFGSESVEPWYNAGNADFPFSRISGGIIDEYGLLATWAVEKLDNSVVWLATDGTVRRAGSGYVPQRISNHAVEVDIAAAMADGSVSNASALRYRQEGHEFWCLTLPNRATWCFDAATQLWHKRESYDKNVWRAQCYSYCYNKHLVGDAFGSTLWQLNLDTYKEGTEHLITEMILPPIHNDGSRFICHEVYMDFEPGVGLTTGQGSDPQVMVSWSRDGKTWSTDEERVSLGAIGEYQARPIIRRLGQHRYLHLRLRISDPVKRALYAIYARIEPCTS